MHYEVTNTAPFARLTPTVTLSARCQNVGNYPIYNHSRPNRFRLSYLPQYICRGDAFLPDGCHLALFMSTGLCFFGNGTPTVVTCQSCCRMTFGKVYEYFVRLH